MFYENNIYVASLATDNTPTNADVEYLMDWMIADPNYKCEVAKIMLFYLYNMDIR